MPIRLRSALAYVAGVGSFLIGVSLTLPSRGQEKGDKKDVIKLPEVKVPGEIKSGSPPAPTPPPAPDTPPPASGTATGPFSPGGVFDRNITTPFLPDVEGTNIYAGKNTTNILLNNQPPIANNNLRQLLITTPSLNISEETSPLTSIGYRGLPPHRTQFMQVLKNGVPIHADMFGYPEAYYIPPFQVIDRVEFIRGGASLMFGPQPGGTLNFISKMPVTDRAFSLVSENMGGSFGFFSTYEAVSGTVGNLGYYVYGHHREAEGFRTSNSGYNLDYGGGTFTFQINDHSRLLVYLDAYSEGHGEPGGLTLNAFNADPRQITRQFDHFQLRRQSVALEYQNAINDETFLDFRFWAIDYNRFSRRQRGGGFGTLPAGAASATSAFETQQFDNFGIEPRLRRDWCAFGEQHTLAFGLMYYHTDSPRTDARGPNLANVGDDVRNASVRQVDYAPFFLENLFRFGDFTVTPGVRIENIWQSVREDINKDKTAAKVPLSDRSVSDTVPLFGLGVGYNLTDNLKAFYNVSQSYRPIIFTEAVVPAANQIVAGDLQPGNSWQTEIGLRGNPGSWLYWETSLFYMRFNDQIGTVANVVQNVGNSRHQGWEFAGQVDWLGAAYAAQGYDELPQASFISFFNTTLLDAEFIAGPNQGNRTQYAPNYLMKAGLGFVLRDTSNTYASAYGNAYHQNEWFRILFTGTFVGNQWGDDGNSANFFIPAYNVWDLTAEARLYREYVRVFGGAYNLFDNQYFSRIRADGIDPASPFNFFAGVRVIY